MCSKHDNQKRTFEVEQPNPYSTEERKVVQIQVLDVLYNNEVCNLIYMQDVTKLVDESMREKAQDRLKLVNECFA